MTDSQRVPDHTGFIAEPGLFYGEAHHVIHSSAILARYEVPELQELVTMRKAGWQDESLDGHFKKLREVSDKPDEKLEYHWYQRMKGLMKEVDLASHAIPWSSPFEFLDIGSAPGGFTAYILQKNARAYGMGITLPESLGGHATLLGKPLRARCDWIEQDILEYDLSCAETEGLEAEASSQPRLPSTLLSRFSVVLLDGHALRTYHHPNPANTPEEAFHAHGAYRHSLLISQLIIALETVRPGGTIIMKLSHIECSPSAQLIYLLDDISASLVVHKPKTIHAIRGTFYAIARKVGKGRSAGPEKQKMYLAGLKALLSELKGGETSGRGRMMTPGDLDFIVTQEVVLEEYLPRLISLGRSVWATQVVGLTKLFDKQRYNGLCNDRQQ